MLFAIKNREDLETFEELVSSKGQVEEFRLQDKLGKQNIHEIMKKVIKPVTDTVKSTSEFLTKTIKETSTNNNRALENINENVSELRNDKGMLAPYLASSLVSLFTSEKTSQFRITKDQISIRMNDFWINTSIPVTLFSNILTFRDNEKPSELHGDIFETVIIYDFNVSHSNPKDQRLIHEFGKELNFNVQQKGRKSNRDKSLIKLLKSFAIMASGISTIFFHQKTLMNFVID